MIRGWGGNPFLHDRDAGRIQLNGDAASYGRRDRSQYSRPTVQCAVAPAICHGTPVNASL